MEYKGRKAKIEAHILENIRNVSFCVVWVLVPVVSSSDYDFEMNNKCNEQKHSELT